MKRHFTKILLIALVLVFGFSLFACAPRTVETDKYSIELPGGYIKSLIGSDDEMQIYTDGLMGSDMITITDYSDFLPEGYSGAMSGEALTRAAILEAYSYIYGSSSTVSVTIGDYNLYEYNDFFDSKGAFYIYISSRGAWIIDFSIDKERYDDFKSQIPDIIASFEPK